MSIFSWIKTLSTSISWNWSFPSFIFRLSRIGLHLFLFCFVTGVTSQKCRRAPHSKLCQSPSHFRHRLVLEPGYPMSGILQSLLWAYYPGISHRASRTDLQWIIDRPAMRLCYQEAVSYYCSVIVGKPYLTILRGSTGYRDSLALSAQALCRTRA